MHPTRDKYPLSPRKLLDIALQHIEAVRSLLKIESGSPESPNFLLPVTTLLYMAIELTLKACLLQDHHKLRPVKGLFALFEQAGWMALSSQEQSLIKQLSQQQAFRKGLDYALWDNPQQLRVFAHRILVLHQQMLAQMPLELHPDYWD